MCGGAGTRFWPFSRTEMPKQFIDFFGTGRTLLQMTYDRISPLVANDKIILVTNAAYAEIVKCQLPQIKTENILLEPARRNTAPCICWATHHIHALDPEAVIVTLPADHLVLKDQEFQESLREGISFVEKGDRLLTLGIKPSSPHTGYGYIQKGRPVDDHPGVMKVKSFTEKPDLPMAELFLKSGEFFWNSGIFIWKSKCILRDFKRYAPEIAAIFDADPGVYATASEQPFIDHNFPNAPSISIDYAIMEKADNVYVKTVDFGWSDLGTWKALLDASPRNAEGNATQNCKVLLHGCHNSMFAAADDKLIVAVGLDNYIVADNGNALLICPAADEQKIRQLVNEVKSRYGERYV